MSKQFYVYLLPADVEALVYTLKSRLDVSLIQPSSSGPFPVKLESPVCNDALMLKEALLRWVAPAVTGTVTLELRRGDDYTILNTNAARSAYQPDKLSMERTASAFTPEDRIGALEMPRLSVPERTRSGSCSSAKATTRPSDGDSWPAHSSRRHRSRSCRSSARGSNPRSAAMSLPVVSAIFARAWPTHGMNGASGGMRPVKAPNPRSA